MKNRIYAGALLISLVFIVAATCKEKQSQSLAKSDRAATMLATASPTPDSPNPAFVVTPDQVRKAFDDAELRGENKQGINLGKEASINVTAKDQLGKLENLKFSVLFLTPLGQARADGYEFGLVAKGRTPADRKDFEDRSVSRIAAHNNEVTFKVFLQRPSNEDATIPPITFILLDAKGNRVTPLSQPDSFVSKGKDIIDIVALAKNGQPLTFPLFVGTAPTLTAKMKKMTLIVTVDGKETSLEYALG
jgi:hypothetical protein